jgi:hypothetical protein
MGCPLGIRSYYAVLLGSLGDETFSTRSHGLASYRDALAIDALCWRTEVRRSPVSALQFVAE